eukprot:GCRY01004235.1.p1 GENE.GCRY01004235.1~~GCRY01004235.1.p1  ORF type:complete len:343 (-),score=32.01 GCRY01004235.1:54-1082(-)
MSSSQGLLKNWEKHGVISEEQLDSLSLFAAEFSHSRAVSEDKLPNSSTSQEEFVDLFQFFEFVLEDTARIEEHNYQLFVSVLRQLFDTIKCSLSQFQTAIEDTNRLRKTYETVHEKTKRINEECCNLLQEKKTIELLKTDVDSYLAVYDELDTLTRRYNSAATAAGAFGPTITAGHNIQQYRLGMTTQDLHDLLARLEQAQQWMESHPQYSDSAPYNHGLALLRQRVFSLVRQYVTGSIRSNVLRVSQANDDLQKEGAVRDTSIFYVKFRALAPKLRPVINAIETISHRPEYMTLLTDFHHTYCQYRLRLIQLTIDAYMNNLEHSGMALVARTRQVVEERRF